MHCADHLGITWQSMFFLLNVLFVSRSPSAIFFVRRVSGGSDERLPVRCAHACAATKIQLSVLFSAGHLIGLKIPTPPWIRKYHLDLRILSCCLKQMFSSLRGPGVRFFHVCPIESRYQLSRLPQPADFPALIQEGKARVAQYWMG